MSSTGSILQIDDFKFQIESKRIYIRLGYRPPVAPVRDSITQLINDLREEVPALLHPTAVYRILDYEETNKHPVFKGADKVALCICTIGKKLENTSARLIEKNEILQGVILDAFGSEAAEAVTRQSDRIIAAEVRKMGLWPSKRFSPGYGIWDLREQEYVFQILPASDIDVRLTETFMMIPRKSVSFRINMYKDKTLTTRSFP